MPHTFRADRGVPGRYSDQDEERWIREPTKTAALTTDFISDRSPFSRDRARVLHSASFRRLAGKTQVVAPDEDDIPRTRLTHSLEVAQISRDIGYQLGCDPDLVDLAGLAHDIGHPPFGHNGEAALDTVGAAAGGFEANAQNLRLLTRLELKVIRPDGTPGGLNLTRAALDAVIKYPWPRPAAGGKFGLYQDDTEVFEWVRRPVAPGPARCLESQVMDWSDDVAYSVHDVEDGILSGRIDPRRLADPAERDEIALVAAAASAAGATDRPGPADLRSLLDELLELPAVADGLAVAGSPAAAGSAVGGAAVKSVTSELTGRFATGAVAGTLALFGPPPLHRYQADLIVPARLRSEVALLKAIAARYVMADPSRRLIQQAQQELLTELVDIMANRGESALDPIFAARYQLVGDDAGRLRVVLDQVSLLTDAQAVHRHHRLRDS